MTARALRNADWSFRPYPLPKELDMTYTKTLLLTLTVCLIAALSPAQQKNKIEGVWQALSQKMDGQETLTSGTIVKYITSKHCIWIYQDKAKCLSLFGDKTASAMAYNQAFGAGAGTYKLVGNSYTETIEYFVDPNYIGLSVAFTTRVNGDRLYQSGKLPMFEGGKRVKDIQLEEVYKRIE